MYACVIVSGVDGTSKRIHGDISDAAGCQLAARELGLGWKLLPNSRFAYEYKICCKFEYKICSKSRSRGPVDEFLKISDVLLGNGI